MAEGRKGGGDRVGNPTGRGKEGKGRKGRRRKEGKEREGKEREGKEREGRKGKEVMGMWGMLGGKSGGSCVSD